MARRPTLEPTGSSADLLDNPIRQLPGQLVGQVAQRDLKLFERRITALTWDQNQIDSGGQIILLQPECLAEQSLQTATTHGIAMFLGNTQSESSSTTLSTNIRKDEQALVTSTATCRINAVKIALVAQTTPCRQTGTFDRTGHVSTPGHDTRPGLICFGLQRSRPGTIL